MNKAGQIFNELRPLLIANWNRCLTNEEIETISNGYRDLLITLGEAFRSLRKVDPTDADFETCQNFIDRSMSKWRELNLSVTPKAHLFEDHAVNQMKNVPGGLGHKTEDFVERNHQDGVRLEIDCMVWQITKIEQKPLCVMRRWV